MKDSPLLVVGLGNPGPKYVGTRHNIGFEVVEELASRNFAQFSVHKKSNTEIAQLPGMILAKPRSFMNLSGTPIRALCDFFKIAPANIIVVHDELELDFAQVKLRQGGGDHGHNGLKSTSQSLGTKDYWKLSVGIGRPPGRMDPASFVLKPFSKQELADVPIMAADAADLVEKHPRN
ncbi:Peptidyl-tRNA hydrolase 1 [Corynebacterium deserti GIMN1.010]|uniref:Peptidyl-tRNA hydrolase n=1 Tax=Corynebacterium deserti GIMN1.010 TaxID=931089 RepID=A0A0M4CKY7_9CORY|nr:aminoacyl-tRNA hydrolase [Corynebacterium deserti]ALC05372.1 Peptidyl-tRNA hydrolase 1 [Corynebacterium deserti GIMN1.010]